MSELLVALLSAALVVGLLIPAATLLTKVALGFLWRRAEPARFGTLGPYLLLVAPSLGVITWLASAALHESQRGATQVACTLEHAGEGCLDALFLASLLVLLGLFALASIWRQARRALAEHPHPERLPPSAPLSLRLARLCQGDPRLRRLRVAAVTGAGAEGLWTRGLLRPWVEVGQSAAARLSDGALLAALYHEAEHVRGRDPLRFLLASTSLRLSPLGWLLRRDLQRWRAAREAACDAAAVRRSADPLALAGALVAIARVGAPTPPLVSALGAEARAVSVRVRLLLSYADTPPRPVSSGLAGALALAPALFAILPHHFGAWPFGELHGGLEHALRLTGLI